MTRYDTSGLVEAQYEPGSRGRVLKNKLGIKSKKEMDRAEFEAQLLALKRLAGMFNITHRFTAKDICRIHKVWLGDIYEWAGKYRRVNLSKGEFPFAGAAQIPRLMQDFERAELKKNTPCNFKTLEETARAIATVHVELVLIHPFREGNGRAARLLADLMAMQANYPPLDYGSIKGKKRQAYFHAIQEGLNRNYEPMTDIFISVLRRTLRRSGEQKTSSPLPP
ncbi:MAG: Fic family protein [Nitrospiraceae bacterium]|nr:Fic family protein [Nitrospiraceae bacterium]